MLRNFISFFYWLIQKCSHILFFRKILHYHRPELFDCYLDHNWVIPRLNITAKNFIVFFTFIVLNPWSPYAEPYAWNYICSEQGPKGPGPFDFSYGLWADPLLQKFANWSLKNTFWKFRISKIVGEKESFNIHVNYYS